jgi:hypothetical protein
VIHSDVHPHSTRKQLISYRREMWRRECTPTTIAGSLGALSLLRGNKSVSLLTLRRHKIVTSITHAALLTISIGAALGFGHAQVLSVPLEPAKSVPATAYGVDKNSHRQSDQVAPTVCSLRVPDTVTQSRAKLGEATTVAGSVIYAPLSRTAS